MLNIYEALPNLLAQYLGPEDFPIPSEQSFSVATFNHCLGSHPECQISNLHWKPTRLIKVDWNASIPVLRLIAGKEIENESRYVALSHCWGRHPIVRLLLENRHSMEQDIPLSGLPKTFQDAISVTGWIKGSYVLLIVILWLVTMSCAILVLRGSRKRYFSLSRVFTNRTTPTEVATIMIFEELELKYKKFRC
jgi:hypothetical protein